ncbi:hypothetical protein [Caulobacter sp. NIBR2454]|uniref:hypothetical protein n=1 Tax=Caulobacter sp. NIBR2454 TaxID=3015996 RepID=UPI0022B6891E|nr:hypothetical protein [Caulobacter sp. NIBR2454]
MSLFDFAKFAPVMVKASPGSASVDIGDLISLKASPGLAFVQIGSLMLKAGPGGASVDFGGGSLFPGSPLVGPQVVQMSHLTPGQVLATTDGADVVQIGLAQGDIDLRAGDDVIQIGQLSGSLAVGEGRDRITIGDFQTGAVIKDFQVGLDTLAFSGASGATLVFSGDLSAQAHLEDALRAAGEGSSTVANVVFAWGGDTYVAHHDGLQSNLMKLVGVTGLSLMGDPATGGLLLG